ncbi:MAG: DUF58 domain-containing protein [Actinomycetota bacterium]
MTRRGVGAGVAVVLLWVAAHALGVPQLQVAALSLLVLLVGAVVWIIVSPLRLEVDRVVEPAVVPFGGRTRIALLVRNTGRVPSPSAWLEDALPGVLGQPRSYRLPVLVPHRMLDLATELDGVHRGRFVLGPLTVTVRDPFGLVQRRRSIDSTAVLTVHPPVWPLPPGVPLGGASGAVANGPRRATIHGDDLADIREYVRGDDLRAVHWASTAHRGRLMVRRAEEATSPRASLLLDIRRHRHAGAGPNSSFEVTVATAASILHHLSGRGRGVTLLDRPTRELAAPMPADAWMPTLAAVTPTEVDLHALLRQVATGAAGEGTLIAVLTTPDPAELAALVRAGRGAASRLAVLVDAPTFAEATAEDQALERAIVGLRAAGWRVTTLAAGERLDERWRELLGRGGARVPAGSAGR